MRMPDVGGVFVYGVGIILSPLSLSLSLSLSFRFNGHYPGEPGLTAVY